MEKRGKAKYARRGNGLDNSPNERGFRILKNEEMLVMSYC